jgi:hypothetical protein
MQGLQECPDKTPDCIKKVITEKNPFNEHGTLRGELSLKTISNGRFVWLLK